MYVDYHLALLTVFQLLLGRQVSGVQGCSNKSVSCQITPSRYATIEVSKENPGNITCTIPNLDGSTGTVRFLNHKGQGVFPSAQSSNISQFVHHRFEQNTDGTSNYYLNITWTGDRYVQEQLKVIQCIANFLGIKRPCRTSLVNVNFATADQDLIRQDSVRQQTLQVQNTTPPDVADKLPSTNVSAKLSSDFKSIFLSILSLFILTTVITN